jgi:hypothetical protein
MHFFFGRTGFIKRSFLLSDQYLHTAPRQLDFVRRANALLSFHSALRVWYLFPFLIVLCLPFLIEGLFGRRRARLSAAKAAEKPTQIQYHQHPPEIRATGPVFVIVAVRMANQSKGTDAGDSFSVTFAVVRFVASGGG